MDKMNLSGLNPKDFQTEIDGKKTDLYILKNQNGYEVAVTNYGGSLVAIMVPDDTDSRTLHRAASPL